MFRMNNARPLAVVALILTAGAAFAAGAVGGAPAFPHPLADYAAAIKLDPGYLRAYENRLRLLEQRGDLTAMAADYRQLAALDPTHAARYRYREGSALYGLRDFTGARPG